MAQYEDFQIDQGTDIVINLECYNPDGSKKILSVYDSDSQTAIGFYTPKAYIKKTYNSSDSDTVQFQATTLVEFEKNNVIQLKLTHQQTNNMKPGRYVYDVEIEQFDSSSNTLIVERILEGKITLTPSVTI
jgi:hypothetical protein